MKLEIWYGKAKPITAIGKNQVALLSFAEKYKGWHSIVNGRAEKTALMALVKKGCIEVNDFGQFKFKYP